MEHTSTSTLPTISPTLPQMAMEPITKYYYLFRKVNIEGFVSNPTSIYEVELVIDADDSKILVEEFKIPEPNISRSCHKFQSLFQIEPAPQQRIFDSTQDVLFQASSLRGMLDDLYLGTADDLIWGRRLKFRIRSTNTGKLIDYNIRFKLTREKTEEDF